MRYFGFVKIQNFKAACKTGGKKMAYKTKSLGAALR